MTVKIVLTTANSRANTGATLPLTYGKPDEPTERIVADSTSKATTMAATSMDQIWEVTPDVDIDADFDVDPDAKSAAVRPLAAGVPRTFGVKEIGEKCAVTLMA